MLIPAAFGMCVKMLLEEIKRLGVDFNAIFFNKKRLYLYQKYGVSKVNENFMAMQAE